MNTWVLLESSKTPCSTATSVQSDKVFEFLTVQNQVPSDVAKHVANNGLCYYKEDGCVKSVYVSTKQRDNRQLLPPARLTKYLYLSDVEYASNDAWRAKNKITHVVHALPTCICWPNFDQHKLVEQLDANNLRVCLYDYAPMDKNIRQVFQPVVDFIDNARASDPNARILVHCAAGVSRSVTLVLMYLVAREQMTLRQAVSHVFEKRPIMNPLWFYMQVLFEVEEGHIVPIRF